MEKAMLAEGSKPTVDITLGFITLLIKDEHGLLNPDSENSQDIVEQFKKRYADMLNHSIFNKEPLLSSIVVEWQLQSLENGSVIAKWTLIATVTVGSLGIITDVLSIISRAKDEPIIQQTTINIHNQEYKCELYEFIVPEEYYTVQPGDTLYSIAKKFLKNSLIDHDSVMAVIYKLNEDKFDGNPNLLMIGKVLLIPKALDILNIASTLDAPHD
ncbi:LysM peptidoglycan-binding domain-containing protein [Shewanella frigidimarina]|uniref:LysM peptidoglycan-binding domain-containing protein n=1 Tax=Shewanella frigidimarina TaxID=56812 RepID=UPI003FA0A47A